MNHKLPDMRVLISIMLLLTGYGALAQMQQSSTTGLLEQGQQLVWENPAQALKIGHHLLKIADSEAERTDANFLLAQSYLASGNSNQALQLGFRAKHESEAACNEIKTVRILLFLSGILQDLQLDKQARQFLAMAQSLAGLQASETIKSEAAIHWALAQADFEQKNPQKGLRLLDGIQPELPNVGESERTKMEIERDLSKGKIFTAMAQNDSAHHYFSKALAQLRQYDSRNLLQRAQVLEASAQVYFQQKQHPKAIALLLEALAMAKKLQHPKLRRDINKQLAINYLAVDNRTQYHRFNQQFLQLGSAIENSENDATNTAFNLISKEQEKRMAAEANRFANIFYAVLACFVLILFFGILQLWRSQSKQRRYQEIVQYLENGRRAVIQPSVKKDSKNLIIPAETEQTILSKLKKFEATSKFTQKEMSLAMLAAQLDTNTKYLSEIINKHYHDNFNTYINKLRINYIIEKMKSEPTYLNYKISYLAEESGFSSHSSFATVFKSITGIAPTSFIDFLKEEAANRKTTSA
ncbi:helix-turn-helix domain-containing protein [Flavobacterium sp.]|uniref:helix-turn-helix domain-containing protein n=1 Tax=Flavobacterium sp. TaxID=239 RepID=UPI0039E45705